MLHHRSLIATLIVLVAALAAAPPTTADHAGPTTVQILTCVQQDDAGSGRDATEWWDAPVILQPGTHAGCVDEEDDEDWFLYSAPGGEAFQVRLSSLVVSHPASPCTGDYDLRVYNSNLFPVASSFEGCVDDTGPIEVFDSEWHVIEVIHFTGGGDYHLEIAQDVEVP